MKASANFPAVGGHIAVDLANTCPLRGGSEVELLQNFDDLVSWARNRELPLRHADLDELRKMPVEEKLESVILIRKLRSALLAYFQRPGDSTLGAIAAQIDEIIGRRSGSLAAKVVDQSITLTFHAPFKSATDLVAVIAQGCADFFGEGQAERIKQCAGHDCVLWFVDTTRNGSRQWCRMDRCGARAKSAAYYRRSRVSQG